MCEVYENLALKMFTFTLKNTVQALSQELEIPEEKITKAMDKIWSFPSKEDSQKESSLKKNKTKPDLENLPDKNMAYKTNKSSYTFKMEILKKSEEKKSSLGDLSFENSERCQEYEIVKKPQTKYHNISEKMILDAVNNLVDQWHSVSHTAIKKYVSANYTVNPKTLYSSVNKLLKTCVQKKFLKKIKYSYKKGDKFPYSF